MWKSLPWVLAATLAVNPGMISGQATAQRPQAPQEGPTLQDVLEIESVARLLAILLDSGRAVINENQNFFDKMARGEKPLSQEGFERQLTDVFRTRSGIDLQDLGSARVPALGKDLLQRLVMASKQVVGDAQADISRAQDPYGGLIPAVFGAKVAAQFTKTTGVRLKQTALTPRNPANTPDPFEKAALQEFADPEYPREKTITEITTRSKALRLMFPLYSTRQCLDCHGEPKGERDRTGYHKEGLQLGQNAGAISVVIPIQK